MRRLANPPATAVAVAALGTLAVWPFLTGGAFRAVVGGAILAVGVQMAVHFLLRGWRARSDRFVAAIAAGFALRVAAVVAATVVFAVTGRAEPVPFLMSLGGFLVALLVAEAVLEYRRLGAGVAAAGSGAE